MTNSSDLACFGTNFFASFQLSPPMNLFQAPPLVLALRLKKKKKNHYWYLQVYGLISVPLSFSWLQENTRLYHGRRRV
jgi:hypothetical protein